MDWEDLYAAGIRDCSNAQKISDAAIEVAEAILSMRPIEIALAPGNATRYCWLFVPFSSTIQFDFDGRLESTSVGNDGVWIANLNGNPTSVYPLSFTPGREVPHYTYLSEKWFNGKENYDLVVFYELLRLTLLSLETFVGRRS